MGVHMKNNKHEIVIKLIENDEKRLTIHQLSQKTGIPYSNVHNIIKKLENEDLVSLEKIGNAYQCRINKKVHPLIFEAEFERRKVLMKNSDFKVLQTKLNSLKFSFTAIIFGSHAKGTASKGSDVDMLVVGESKRETDIERTVSILPLNIHFLFFSYEEFLSMSQSREFNVVSEAIKSNVILVGIEDYYRLMENVG